MARLHTNLLLTSKTHFFKPLSKTDEHFVNTELEHKVNFVQNRNK